MVPSLRDNYRAVVIGATGGIGHAFAQAFQADPRCGAVVGLSRRSQPAIELTDQQSIATAAASVKDQWGDVDIVVVATGLLAPAGSGPEKSIRDLELTRMAEMFSVNTIGPALITRYFAPLLSKKEKSVLAFLSARVGSVADNHLGGWLSYRSSKAALNQVVRTASIEISRTRPQAVCLALHPGTVETKLSADFTAGRQTFTPAESANRLLRVMDQATPPESGSFLAYDGSKIVW